MSYLENLCTERTTESIPLNMTFSDLRGSVPGKWWGKRPGCKSLVQNSNEKILKTVYRWFGFFSLFSYCYFISIFLVCGVKQKNKAFLVSDPIPVRYLFPLKTSMYFLRGGIVLNFKNPLSPPVLGWSLEKRGIETSKLGRKFSVLMLALASIAWPMSNPTSSV